MCHWSDVVHKAALAESNFIFFTSHNLVKAYWAINAQWSYY